MAKEDRFLQSVIVTLAKRAANQCSNPDCRAVTSGPTEEPSGSVNVGEAAHIFGANPGSARYDADMVSADRSAITNAIWLCCNCHKLVDDDEHRYPAGLLFEWQREHERWVSAQVGKAGAELRRRYEDRHLEEFGSLSYLAERLILEKPDHWEYQLTAEVLRFEMAPILRRWDALKRGLYMRPMLRLSGEEFVPFVTGKFAELIAIAKAFSQLTTNEFDDAWGEPGVPGDEVEIVQTCRLYAEMCQSALAWEEAVRFTSTIECFKEPKELLVNSAGRIIDEARRVPEFMKDLFEGETVSGEYWLTLHLDLPKGWEKAFSSSLNGAMRAFQREQRR
ncbi:HNH endonuclease [Synechococcus moorigangaii CMS01]|nr:HNH endonuclease [Synechococcus moorigangaii CMS01]